jgi:ubiquinone/menaquinone biosynthesis C-methylase UbiE
MPRGLRERTYQIQRVGLSRRIEEAMRYRSISLAGLTIADIGCGRGYWLDRFRELGASEKRLFGIDFDPARLVETRNLNTCVADACLLPFPSSAFDVVSQFTLFSSLQQTADRFRAAREMLRVLKPGGWIFWHDFFVWNPLNRQTRPVPRSELFALFPGCTIDIEKVTLIAPLARLLCRVSGREMLVFDRFPALRTHYLAFIRKPSSTQP